MSEPFVLGAPPPAATDSLFFALFPPDAARASLLALDRGGLRGRPQAPERLHLTLAYLGDFAGVPADLLHAATQAARRLRHAPVAVSLDTLATFPSRRAQRPYVLRGSAEATPLHAFQRQLVQALLRGGALRRAEPAFVPHVTLSYEPDEPPSQRLAPVEWIAREFVLVRSFLGQSRYAWLERFALDGAAE
jgi:2'-5' RNA ligase